VRRQANEYWGFIEIEIYGVHCTVCGVGAYQDGPGASTCATCPEGSTTAGAVSAARTDCVCGSAFTSSITDSGGGCACAAANKYPKGSTNTCEDCPANTASAAGSTSLMQCSANAGYYVEYTRHATATISVPVEVYDEGTFLSTVLAGAGDGARLG
jgi:hypothetical protein